MSPCKDVSEAENERTDSGSAAVIRGVSVIAEPRIRDSRGPGGQSGVGSGGLF